MRNKIIFALSILGVLGGLVAAYLFGRERQAQAPVFQPISNPYASAIYANGMIESEQTSGEDINIFPEVSGPITHVLVSEGQKVAAGTILLTIDDTLQRGATEQLRLQAEASLALLGELKAQPRAETLAVAKAQVGLAESNLKVSNDQYDKRLASFNIDPKSISKDVLDTAGDAVSQTAAALDVARKQYNLMKVGAWSYDIVNQQRQHDALEQAYQTAAALLQKFSIRAQADGVVMTINASAGSYVSPLGAYDAYTEALGPLIVMGTPQDHLDVRCYVDEILISRLPSPSHIVAQMSIEGTDTKIPLEFVRVQPYVSPKIELSNQRQEKVDLRVLPVILPIREEGRAGLSRASSSTSSSGGSSAHGELRRHPADRLQAARQRQGQVLGAAHRDHVRRVSDDADDRDVAGILDRAYSNVTNIGAAIWIMDPAVNTVTSPIPMPNYLLDAVRSIDGVTYAVPLFIGGALVKLESGTYQTVTVVGLDDASLFGRPEMEQGSILDIYADKSFLVVDDAEFPKLENPRVGTTFELNDFQGKIVGIARVAANGLNGVPTLYTTYNRAIQYIPSMRFTISYVLVQPRNAAAVATIKQQVAKLSYIALTKDEFNDQITSYYTYKTGIGTNILLMTVISFIVGLSISGQTFYTFILENLEKFGALKAIGAKGRELVYMILFMAAFTALTGYGLGLLLVTLMISIARHALVNYAATITFWNLGLALGMVIVIAAISSYIGIRKVLKIEPFDIFRG